MPRRIAVLLIENGFDVRRQLLRISQDIAPILGSQPSKFVREARAVDNTFVGS